MKNFIIRTISGFFFVALVIGSIFLGKPWFSFLITIFYIISVKELFNLANKDNNDWLSLLFTMIIGVTYFGGIIASYGYGSHFGDNLWYNITKYLWAFFIIIYFIAILYSKKEFSFRRVGITLFAIAYLAIPLSFLIRIEAKWLYVIFAAVWANDTFAYLVGSTIGKHRLMERISPKKSWEGFFGGIILSTVSVTLITHYFFNFIAWKVALFVLVINIFQTWGDLFESLIKRYVGTKDSGNIIPGHGGILDRLDSIFFAAPVAYIALRILGCF